MQHHPPYLAVVNLQCSSKVCFTAFFQALFLLGFFMWQSSLWLLPQALTKSISGYAKTIPFGVSLVAYPSLASWWTNILLLQRDMNKPIGDISLFQDQKRQKDPRELEIQNSNADSSQRALPWRTKNSLSCENHRNLFWAGQRRTKQLSPSCDPTARHCSPCAIY